MIHGVDDQTFEVVSGKGLEFVRKKTNIFLYSFYYVPFKRSIKRLIEYFELDYFLILKILL